MYYLSNNALKKKLVIHLFLSIIKWLSINDNKTSETGDVLPPRELSVIININIEIMISANHCFLLSK